MRQESAYTGAVGEAGQRYMADVHSAIGGPRLSGTFRWQELFDHLVAAAGLSNASQRIGELLRYNNEQVEKRRAATTLLREAGELFRFYEANHRAKVTPAGPESSPDELQRSIDAITKADRNAEIAGRIETFLSEIHQ